MKQFRTESVLAVRHWNESLFSFTTTRSDSVRFENGHFLTIGLQVDGRPVMRAYSIASANYEETLEFFSIKVPNGTLTSRLQHLKPGDQILINPKATGTLLIDDLLPGKHLYLLATGTGLAPFLSIIKDPETYRRFDKVVLVHGVRYARELAYQDFIERELPIHEFIGADVRDKLLYYPTVTREPYRHQGRITDLIATGRLFEDIGLPPLSRSEDRFMICGNPTMLKDMSAILNASGFEVAPQIGVAGHYVIERAFVA